MCLLHIHCVFEEFWRKETCTVHLHFVCEESLLLLPPLQNLKTTCTGDRECISSQDKMLDWFEIRQQPRKCFIFIQKHAESCNLPLKRWSCSSSSALSAKCTMFRNHAIVSTKPSQYVYLSWISLYTGVLWPEGQWCISCQTVYLHSSTLSVTTAILEY